MEFIRKSRLLMTSVVTVLLVTIFSTTVFATDTNQYVKIGLTRELSNQSEIVINNTDICVGYNYDEFETLPLTLESSTGFSAENVNSIYIRLPETATTPREIQSDQQYYLNLGFDAVIYMLDNENYGLVMGPYSSIPTAQQEIEYLFTALGINTTLVSVNDKIALESNGTQQVLFANDDLWPDVTTFDSDEYMQINNSYEYRGAIEFIAENNCVQLVNVVLLEEYLYGLVPAEMPASWSTEALKAQAVAARTYALRAIANSKHSDDGYDLCDSTDCQVYKGVLSEQPSTNLAVDSTYGQAMYYNNQLIEALFGSSNGGSTTNSEDAWNSVVPYLRAKNDPYETNDSSWTREFTQNELTNLVASKQSGLGEVESVVIDQTDSYGRATSLTFICENGNYSVKKDAIRTLFSSTSGGSLDSTNFTITQNLSSTDTITTTNDIDNLKVLVNSYIADFDGDTSAISSSGIDYVSDSDVFVVDSSGVTTEYSQDQVSSGGTVIFSGTGWGHGVGMSQYGAKGMAEQGYTYDQILKFYYTGIDIR